MGILSTTIFLALMVASVLAATGCVKITQYETSVGTVVKGSEPPGRGTFKIILGASATFAFCIWRAVHPDIVPAVPSRYRFFYKSIWMLVAMLLPEGIMVCAYGQLQEARGLHRAWIKRFKPKEGDERQEGQGQRKKWVDNFGMKGAFLVVMGGFIVDEFKGSEESPKTEYLPCYKRTMVSKSVPCASTLTPTGFVEYLRTGQIDDSTFGPSFDDDGNPVNHAVGTTSLADKGNSSVPAKFIAVVQIVWFLAQCISRGVNKLPLTLLEIHVAIQVLTALIIWGCWLHKPSDVNEPILIRLQEPRDPEANKTAQDTPQPAAQSFSREKDSRDPEANKLPQDTPQPSSESFSRKKDSRDKRLRDSEKYQTSDSDGKSVPHSVITRRCSPRVTVVAAKAAFDISKYIDHGKNNTLVVAVEGFLVCIIGTLHAAAWNTQFPTVIESIIWKVSSIGMCVFPLIIAGITIGANYQGHLLEAIWGAQFLSPGVFNITVYAVRKVTRVCTKAAQAGREGDWTWSGVLRILFNFLMAGICGFCLLAYAFSICFITVESYISMRRPDIRSFETSRWDAYWPHL